MRRIISKSKLEKQLKNSLKEENKGNQNVMRSEYWYDYGLFCSQQLVNKNQETMFKKKKSKKKSSTKK